MPKQIAVSVEVKIIAGAEMWVDADEWAKLTKTQKWQRMTKFIDDMSMDFSSDVLTTREGTLSLELHGPIKSRGIQVYDPAL